MDIPWYILANLGFFALLAGFIDSIVGGGGLVQFPATLVSLPNAPLASIFGTNKIASISGTTISAYSYAKRVKFNYPLIIVISVFGFIASYFGANAVTILDPNKLKPTILVLMILIAIYTFLKKDLGSSKAVEITRNKQFIGGVAVGALVGFYDGFLGPGAGSLYVLGFVSILGFDFLHASAYSKIINWVTNFSALTVFIKDGHYIIEVALVMSIFNIIGNVVGTRMAISKGNGFIRFVFMIVVSLMILRYGYEVFFKQ